MATFLAPGVYFETVDTSRQRIAALRTDIAAFVGIAERGPLHQPIRLTSLKQFLARFGNFLPNGFLAYSVKAFFENGGQTCYVVRVAMEAASPSQGVLLDETGTPTLRIEANSPGTWGDRLAVRVGRSHPAAAPTAGVQSDDRSASAVASTTGFPVGSLVHVFQEQPPTTLSTSDRYGCRGRPQSARVG